MKYLNRKYQQGGTAQGGDPQAQMAQQIAQALQQGTKPEVLLQALVKQGMPQDQAQQMIQSVMQQMQQQQGGQPQSAKNGAKLEFIQRLQSGGAYVRPAAKDATNVASKEPIKPI